MTSQYSHIFDDWDGDGPDISMVDLGESGIEHDLSDRQTLNHARNSSYHDDASGRSLLRAESSATRATTTDYEPSTPSSMQKDVRSPSFQNSEVLNSPEGPRQRFPGISNNFPRLWHKKSAASQRTTSTFDGHFAHGKPGWWKKQMLVDRSLRSMAAFTALCAVVMWIIVFSYLKDFIRRPNLNSTSVGDPKGESCETMEQRNVAVHFFINIAATMVLGCSNTYQQLVTSLKVSEMRWVLSKRGDSRVGTNSPWAINHKQTGKTKAWAAWLLLISTSIPVHFLANSVVGPSFYISMPTNVNYSPGPANATSVVTYPSGYSYSTNIYTENTQRYDSACWTAFRAGTYVLPQNLDQLAYDWNVDKLGNSTSYSTVSVQYMTQNCTEYVNSTDWQSALGEVVYDNDLPRGDIYGMTYTIGSCTLGQSVMCTIQDPKDKECRLNVRMQAAFTLAGCLLIKAAYMIILNYRARGKVKEQCLTYGDVIVASVLDPELKIHNECLLNSGDGYRHAVQHTCHKHCKDPVPSTTGDGIGHCQKCKKFNVTNMAADLPHPSIAIKYKRSLLSNLGSTAVTQMIILMICSLCMISVSLMLAVIMGSAASDIHSMCREGREDAVFSDYGIQCSQGAHTYLKRQFGTWGGFSSSATLGGLSPDSLGSEFTAFAISNGAQFLYSLLYLLLIYNLTLISMEHEWGSWETKRRKPRCTIVRGRPFEQSYFLQLPSRILLPMMAFAASMHWLLGEAISTIESIYVDPVQSHHIEHSIYFVTYASYPIWLSTILMVAMTAVCWWAFTFTREGFIPQMYGSIRTVCASTTELTDFGPKGILWGDLGMGLKFRHAGFSADEPEKIVPAELYCGKGE